MPDDLYERAKRRYENLKAEIDDIKAYLDAHDRVAEQLQSKDVVTHQPLLLLIQVPKMRP